MLTISHLYTQFVKRVVKQEKVVQKPFMFVYAICCTCNVYLQMHFCCTRRLCNRTAQ